MVRGSGEGGQDKVPGVLEGSGWVVVGCFSVLQHCLVALEHTLGNLGGSALQRHLREREVEQG